MKYLIAGLGNIGPEYAETRHNIGFKVLDALVKASNISFQDKRYAFKAEYRLKGNNFILIKPTTFMNLSGNAIRYWLRQEKIPIENLLVIVDDIALPFGKLRIKPRGGDAGHNGLSHINQTFGHQNYARLRFGIGDEFPRGHQVNYVLGEWSPEEIEQLPKRIDQAIEMIRTFGLVGLEFTMNRYNNK